MKPTRSGEIQLRKRQVPIENPNSEQLKTNLESSKVCLSFTECEEKPKDDESQEEVNEPWQTGVFHQPQTFSPVAKLTSVRILIAMAATRGWPLYQMGVNNAFLYGTLDHVIYMTQPFGFEYHSRLGHVCKLKKTIYGLKQSSRAWYGKIAEFLGVNGFESTTSDASLFVKHVGPKLQPTVSLSTTEAEYRSAAMATQESAWLLRLLSEMGQNVKGKMVLWCDNISAIKLAENPTFLARTKHIKVQYHCVREKVLQGEIDLKYVSTKDQVADLFTKGLNRNKMLEFMEKLGMKKEDVEREFDDLATHG
ncbi:hypothetical protein E3N88_24352 [Mikania micrantha]|uniref:Reverse transcriptase Ty1/copia-type domain-containing protein n=1 Tax=Mikania micrantha TaxID=192012 RepID=A0A5N6N1Z0_9ASTR|nr:hypothetical protein E3N88_24352 [Mikania micrantha]